MYSEKKNRWSDECEGEGGFLMLPCRDIIPRGEVALRFRAYGQGFSAAVDPLQFRTWYVRVRRHFSRRLTPIALVRDLVASSSWMVIVNSGYHVYYSQWYQLKASKREGNQKLYNDDNSRIKVRQERASEILTGSALRYVRANLRSQRDLL